MITKQLFLFGRNGEIKHLIEPPFRRPVIELDADLFEEEALVINPDLPPFEQLKNYLQPIYQAWGRFGYLGDIIAFKVICLGGVDYCSLSYIGRLSVIKANLAVDLMMLVRTKTSNYFIGIKRKNNPGQGKLAFPGGFIDVNGYHLDTPLQTIIHEAEEEIGLKIKVINQADLDKYEPAKTLVKIDFDGEELDGELIPLGIIPTGDDECLPTTGLKRVYHSTAFALLLDALDTDLDEAGINNWLIAGDDASDLVVVCLNDKPKLEFGISHHQKMYDDLLETFSEAENNFL